ncbi:hypothetical protein F5Y17DRAFT_372671 [Xylariaceae sp. FL0594]|nr:hypothetical protein F5Y17DRAFT_372671 [Xylariaceae sp. FL0594]
MSPSESNSKAKSKSKVPPLQKKEEKSAEKSINQSAKGTPLLRPLPHFFFLSVSISLFFFRFLIHDRLFCHEISRCFRCAFAFRARSFSSLHVSSFSTSLCSPGNTKPGPSMQEFIISCEMTNHGTRRFRSRFSSFPHPLSFARPEKEMYIYGAN